MSGRPRNERTEKRSAGDWRKSSTEAISLLDALAPQDPEVVRKLMFGWPCLFANGNLFAGMHREGLVLRLPDSDRAKILKQSGVVEFAPMPGRIMKGYVMIASPLAWKRDELASWIDKSLAFGRQLPPKAKPAKKERK